MIVVTIDLYSAVTRKKKCLGTMIIANVGGTKHRGDYDVRVAHGRDAGNIRAAWERPHRVAEVVNYPRLSYSVWRLVSRAIHRAFPEEK